MNGASQHEGRDLRRFKVNDDYFGTIDTPAKAYILGLLASDGNLRKDMPSVRLRMLKDDELFGKIKAELDSNRPIKDYTNEKGNMMSTLEIYSKKMHADLQNLGLKPGLKASDLRFPDTTKIRREYQPDFIRGFFDGDGSVSKFDRKRGDIGFDCSFVGNQVFLERVKDVLEKNCNVNNVKLKLDSRTKGTYKLKYGGPKNMGKLYEYMYGRNVNPENQLCMRRKYEKMMEAYEYYKERIFKRSITDVATLSQEMVEVVKKKPCTISNLADQLDHKRSTIKKYGKNIPELEIAYPDGRQCVFKIKGHELKDQVYPEKYPDKVLKKYLTFSQVEAFKKFMKAGLYDYSIKKSYADIAKRIGLSADNVKHQAERIKKVLLTIRKDELK